MKSIIKTSCSAALAIILVGCGSTDNGFTSGGPSGTNIIAQKNFSVGFSDSNPAVVDADGNHGGIEVDIVIRSGDRNNAAVTAGTVQIRTEYGILSASSCQLDSTGTCTVTWTSILQGIPVDLYNTVIAYTSGEESFFDFDGSGTYNPANDAIWLDTGEPYINMAPVRNFASPTYNPAEDILIDSNNNGVYDSVLDPGFNGYNCVANCASSTITTIWATSTMNLYKP